MKTAIQAEHDDAMIDRVESLDWTSTIASGHTFVRSDRLLYPCWMCGEPGRHDGNLYVRCTKLECMLHLNPVPRAAWQQAGGDAKQCMIWAKRFWKLQGKHNGIAKS